MRRPTKDIVKIEIVEKINKKIEVTIDADTAELILSKLYVCDLKWLRVGDTVIDNQERSATIEQIGEEEGKLYIVVRKGDPFIWTSRVITSMIEFHFMAGNPNDVNKEWLNKNINEAAKLPLIWMVLPVTDTNNDDSAGMPRVSDLRLYFIGSTELNFDVDESYDQSFDYLWSIVEGFLESAKRNAAFAPVENYVTRELYRFGSEDANGNFERVIIDADLFAIEMRFSLRIRNGKICNC